MTYPPPGAPTGWYAQPGPQDVVVGEAVALHLRLAKLPSRGLALMVDLAILGVLMLTVGGIAGAVAASADDALAAAVVLGSIVLLVVGWPVGWETLSRGRSPGKMLFGLRVVRDDGGPIRFRHAFTRALAAVFVDFNPLLLGAVGVIVSLCSSKGKRVGDLMAGTVVVRERVPHCAAPPAPVPHHLAAWAADLPVTRLSDQVALQARAVLSRRTELHPEQAQYWTARLADEVLAELGAAAPAGTDQVSLLSAVLNERRARELARAGWGAAPVPGWPGGPLPGWSPPPPQWSDPAQGWSAPARPAPTPAYGGGTYPPAPYPPSQYPPSPYPASPEHGGPLAQPPHEPDAPEPPPEPDESPFHAPR